MCIRDRAGRAGEETAVLGAWDTRRAVSGSVVDVSGGRKWELI